MLQRLHLHLPGGQLRAQGGGHDQPVHAGLSPLPAFQRHGGPLEVGPKTVLSIRFDIASNSGGLDRVLRCFELFDIGEVVRDLLLHCLPGVGGVHDGVPAGAHRVQLLGAVAGGLLQAGGAPLGTDLLLHRLQVHERRLQVHLRLPGGQGDPAQGPHLPLRLRGRLTLLRVLPQALPVRPDRRPQIRILLQGFIPSGKPTDNSGTYENSKT